jgi:FG-GAP repeat protein
MRYVACPDSRFVRALLDRIALAAGFATMTLSGFAAAQAAADPVRDTNVVLQAVTPSERARFGFSMEMGSFGTPVPGGDTLVIGAQREGNSPPYSTFSQVGSVFPFEGPTLLRHSVHARMIPGGILNDEMHMGRLDIAIGKFEGPTTYGLLIVGVPRRTNHYWECPIPQAVQEQGTIEIHDLRQPAFASLLGSYRPPLNPGDVCANSDTGWFGHALSVDNVVRAVPGESPVEDLVVGAPQTQHLGIGGMVYVLAGHPTFARNPMHRWIAWGPPPTHPPGLYNGHMFGFAAAAQDLDGDGLAEVIVAAPARGVPGGGTVFLYRGSRIQAELDSAPNRVISSFVPDQTLLNPNILTGEDDNGDTWGWRIYKVGDVGVPVGSAVAYPDSKADLAFYNKRTKGDLSDPLMTSGALWVYFNNATSTAPFTTLVDDSALLAKAKITVSPADGGPQNGARFGRSAARVQWKEAGSDTPVVGIAVGEMDRDFGGFTNAGRVLFYKAPIVAGAGPFNNAWSQPLTERPWPRELSRFGAWIVAGDYLAEAGNLVQEIIISCRSATTNGFPEAGSAQAFRAGP